MEKNGETTYTSPYEEDRPTAKEAEAGSLHPLAQLAKAAKAAEILRELNEERLTDRR